MNLDSLAPFEALGELLDAQEPSTTLILHNVGTKDELEGAEAQASILSDIRGEMVKFGTITSLYLQETRVAVGFDNIISAGRAQQEFNGRLFANRPMLVTFQ
jgi:hypothetical protein